MAYRYLYFDSVLYREPGETGWYDGFLGGSWKPITPSEQDLEGMRAVTLAEAAELQPEAELDGAELD